MHWSASNDDVDAIKALVAGGADQNQGGGIFGNGTALWDAAIFGQKKALRCLLGLGSDPMLKCISFDGQQSQTLLEFLGDDARIEDEVREIVRKHMADDDVDAKNNL